MVTWQGADYGHSSTDNGDRRSHCGNPGYRAVTGHRVEPGFRTGFTEGGDLG